jgi:hypothetical protein
VLSLTFPLQIHSTTVDAFDSHSEDCFGVLTKLLPAPSPSEASGAFTEFPSLSIYSLMKKDLLPACSILILGSVLITLLQPYSRKSRLKAAFFFPLSEFSVFKAFFENSFNDRFFEF